MIKALVVDDDTVFQNLLSKLLGSHGIHVVGRASRLEQAIMLYEATWPDVVLIGLSSVDKDKLEGLSKIKELDPMAKVIVLSIFDSVEDVAHGAEALIDGYVIKGSSSRKIVSTVEGVIAGDKEQ